MTSQNPLRENPFAVQTPEDIAAREVADLFVDVFTDFYHIPSIGHTFLHGPRGSGKSMMFRYLEPDCQQAKLNRSLEQLPFYSVYVPIKNTDLKLTELARLDNKHANYVLNEHLLTVYVGSRVLRSLQTRANIEDSDGRYAKALRGYFEETFKKLIIASGWNRYSDNVSQEAPVSAYVGAMTQVFDDLYNEVSRYLKYLSFRKRPLPYSGALCGYLDFLLPMLRGLRALPFMPKGPIFLLLDDADNLNEAQTRILNSWVFCRTSSEVSLKISTQLNYKTYRTTADKRIDSPHDYTETNISTVYASAKSKYYERVNEIVRKRLSQANINRSPQDFFPEYKKQEEAIQEIAQQYIVNWDKSGRGHRARDDAYRYARPDYIRSLSGKKKASSKYKYAGFEQLVYLSSGVIRYFLEAAFKMYAEVCSKSRKHDAIVEKIDPTIQDQVMRDEADGFMFDEFDKLTVEEGEDAPSKTDLEKLRNLIFALGGAFHLILLSGNSERRIFSVALSDPPDPEVSAILALGTQYGYLHESSIGNKEGTGRTKLFVLSRRLAPFFSLDPTGFAGYKFVTSRAISEAMTQPKLFVERLNKNLAEVFEEPPQRVLFEESK